MERLRFRQRRAVETFETSPVIFVAYIWRACCVLCCCHALDDAVCGKCKCDHCGSFAWGVQSLLADWLARSRNGCAEHNLFIRGNQPQRTRWCIRCRKLAKSNPFMRGNTSLLGGVARQYSAHHAEAAPGGFRVH